MDRPYPEEGSCGSLRDWYVARRNIILNRRCDDPTNSSNIHPLVKELCVTLNSIPGIVTGCISGKELDPFRVWFYAYNQAQLFVVARAIDRRYCGAAAWRMYVDAGDMQEFATSYYIEGFSKDRGISYSDNERDEVRIPHVVKNIKKLLDDQQCAMYYGYDTDQTQIPTVEELASYEKLEDL